MKHLLLGVALGATFHLGTARRHVHLQQAPAAAAAAPDAPTLDTSEEGRGSSVIERCMRELDARTDGWLADDAALSGFLSHVGRGEACSMVLQHSAGFDSGDGQKAPFLRAVGYFPGATPEDILVRMIDPPSRLQWDRNYVFFEAFPEADTVPVLCHALRPFRRAVPRTTVCSDGACRLVFQDVHRTLEERGWLAHKVGNKLLHKVGLSDRLMTYERRTFGYSVDAASVGVSMYDVVYNGSRETVRQATSASPAYARWLARIAGEGSCSLCDVNYQHLMLLPIVDAGEQLVRQPDTLRSICVSGSLVDVGSTKLLYDFIKQGAAMSAERRGVAAETELAGTLLLMTSANNIEVPKALPAWFQTRVMNMTSAQAYGYLASDLKNAPKHDEDGRS